MSHLIQSLNYPFKFCSRLVITHLKQVCWSSEIVHKDTSLDFNRQCENDYSICDGRKSHNPRITSPFNLTHILRKYSSQYLFTRAAKRILATASKQYVSSANRMTHSVKLFRS